MRTADDDGMQLVLCTPEGPTEVWLSADGSIKDETPADSAPSQVSDCLAITLSLVLVLSWIETLAQPAALSPYRATFIDRRRTLILTRTPQQPRAPPRLV
nr:hypothetical protein [Pseudorhodobacter aquimaris]